MNTILPCRDKSGIPYCPNKKGRDRGAPCSDSFGPPSDSLMSATAAIITTVAAVMSAIVTMVAIIPAQAQADT
jgi:hypothetical protein